MRVWEERSKYQWILDMSYLWVVMRKLEAYHTWMKANPEEVEKIRKKLEGLHEEVDRALVGDTTTLLG